MLCSGKEGKLGEVSKGENRPYQTESWKKICQESVNHWLKSSLDWQAYAISL